MPSWCRCDELCVCLLELHIPRELALLHIRGPQRQVVSQELHDERRVLVRLLPESVELRDGLVEGLLGEVAGTLGRVDNLVEEHGEVKRQPETDGVRGSQVT